MTTTDFSSGPGVFGTLGNVTLHDLIQMLSLGRRSATLTLRQGNAHGHMYFRDGQILHAEAGPFQGEDGILELLQWQSADFRIEDGIASLPRVTIGKKVDAVLLGTLTRLDRLNHVDSSASELRDAPARQRRARSLPPRRYPRRPVRGRSRHVSRSLSVAALLLAAVALAGTSFLGAPYAAGAIAPWMGEPWKELPEVHRTPSAAAPRAPLAADAWSVLERGGGFDADPAPAPAIAAPRELPVVAPAAPPAEPGFLTVVVEPWARVWIDDRLVGETPLGKQELSAGEHRIRLENDAVVGVVRDRVAVEPGASLVRRYDFGHVGYLQLLVRPWAEVEVDGRAVGETPLARVSVPVGSHTVVLKHPQLGRFERTVEVLANDTTVVEHDWGAAP